MSRGRGRDVTDDGEPVRIKQGRRAPYTQLGDWVMLAPPAIVRHAAKVLYWSLSAHLTVKQDDEDTPPELRVNPTLEMLAAMLGYSNWRKLAPYLKDLEDLGAIEVATELVPGEGNRRRNSYTIHQSPPEDYEHHESLGEFYRAWRRAKAAERAVRKAERAAEMAARAQEIAANQGVPGSPNGDPEPGYPNGHAGPGYPNGDPDIEQDVGTTRRKKTGGPNTSPQTPVFLPAGRVENGVTIGGDQQSNHQTACAGGRADDSKTAEDNGSGSQILVSATPLTIPQPVTVRGFTTHTAPETDALVVTG